MRVYILNDTEKAVPKKKPHFGCQLVMETFREQLNRVGIELVATISGRVRVFDHLDDADLIIVNGEGSIHHENRNELIDVAERYPCVLLNAVYQENAYRPGLEAFKKITVRESRSQAALRDLNLKSSVVPDVIFSSQRVAQFKDERAGNRLHSVRRCLLPMWRRVGQTDDVLNEERGFSARTDAETYLRKVSGYDAICSGRFHTAVIAACLDIPFAAWPSNTHKIEGMLEDMDAEGLMGANPRDARSRIPEKSPEAITRFVGRAKELIDAQFEELWSFT